MLRPFLLVTLLPLVLTAPVRAEVPEVDERAARVHREALVVDGHNDVTTWILDYGFDLGMDGADPEKTEANRYWIPGSGLFLPEPRGEDLRTDRHLARLREGGVDAQFFSIFAHPSYGADGAFERAMAMIEALEEQLRRHPEALEKATQAADPRRIAAEGRIAAFMGLEGGHAIENDLSKLRTFHERGVRYMTLTWSNTHDWADASTDEARHGGLTDFGREVVREMNRLGMLVDLSHVSDETFYDALEVTRTPVILSHSSVRSLADHPRNVSDDMLRAISENGGVVMITFVENFLDPAKTSTWASVWHALVNLGWEDTPFETAIDHLEHAIRVAGVDHVGLGSDFDGTLFLPEGLKDVSHFPHITAALLALGHSEADVRKVLGGNVLRVLEAAEAEAARRPEADLSGP